MDEQHTLAIRSAIQFRSTRELVLVFSVFAITAAVELVRLVNDLDRFAQEDEFADRLDRDAPAKPHGSAMECAVTRLALATHWYTTPYKFPEMCLSEPPIRFAANFASPRLANPG